MGRPIQIDVDWADPERLAAFWAELLDYRVADPSGEHRSWREYSEVEANEPGEAWCRANGPAASGPSILFHRVPERKVAKNRLHLDVLVTEVAETRTRPVSSWRPRWTDSSISVRPRSGRDSMTDTATSSCRTPKATSSA